MWVLLILVFVRILQLKVFTRYATKHGASHKKTKQKKKTSGECWEGEPLSFLLEGISG